MIKQLNFGVSPTPPKISQQFVSLEGEGRAIGQPSIYIRLAGCYSAACRFCDTKYSWGDAPKFKDIADPELTLAIAEELKKSTPKRLTITGGEPLHYMQWFPSVYKWINSISKTKITFLGIESNGNLLKEKEHCTQLLSSFNEIIRENNVIPTLTISPKLDAETCYDEQLSQDDVDAMYYTTFENISKYLQAYPVYFKFIYDYTGDYIDFERELKFINFLLDDLKVGRKHIMLMPFTPEDPLGEGKQIWEESKDATSRQALKYGVTYSPRIHIDRKLD